MMIYLKSTLAGLLTALAATIALLILVVVGIIIYGMVQPPREGSVGWDPISLIHPSLPIVVLVVVCFASGFFWEFRRLTHR